MKDKMRQCFHLIQELISDDPDKFNNMSVEDFTYYLLDEIQN